MERKHDNFSAVLQEGKGSINMPPKQQRSSQSMSGPTNLKSARTSKKGITLIPMVRSSRHSPVQAPSIGSVGLLGDPYTKGVPLARILSYHAPPDYLPQQLLQIRCSCHKAHRHPAQSSLDLPETRHMLLHGQTISTVIKKETMSVSFLPIIQSVTGSPTLVDHLSVYMHMIVCHLFY